MSIDFRPKISLILPYYSVTRTENVISREVYLTSVLLEVDSLAVA